MLKGLDVRFTLLDSATATGVAVDLGTAFKNAVNAFNAGPYNSLASLFYPHIVLRKVNPTPGQRPFVNGRHNVIQYLKDSFGNSRPQFVPNSGYVVEPDEDYVEGRVYGTAQWTDYVNGVAQPVQTINFDFVFVNCSQPPLSPTGDWQILLLWGSS